MSQPDTAEAKPTTSPKTGETFPLTLAGDAVELRVTPDGMARVSRAFAGLIPALDRLRAVDIDAMGVVVHVGLGRPDGSGLKKTITAVAKSDLAEVVGACIGFVSRCLNGPSKA